MTWNDDYIRILYNERQGMFHRESICDNLIENNGWQVVIPRTTHDEVRPFFDIIDPIEDSGLSMEMVLVLVELYPFEFKKHRINK